MASAGCAFGGTPGAWPSLTPSPTPPARGHRVIPGAVWWRLVFWPWRQYLAARAANIPASPPFLAASGSPGVYFTDRQSLQGILGPADFAWRVGLAQPVQAECQKYGCAVIEFDVPDPTNAVIPPPYAGIQQGLTTGGGREWIARNNIGLDETMVVTFVDTTRSGPRYFILPL